MVPVLKDKLITYLEHLASGRTIALHSKRWGLCNNLEYEFPANYSWIKSLMVAFYPSWKYFSKNFAFPVPDPNHLNDFSKAERYYYAKCNDNLWDPDSEYGKLRYDLVKEFLEYVKRLA